MSSFQSATAATSSSSTSSYSTGKKSKAPLTVRELENPETISNLTIGEVRQLNTVARSAFLNYRGGDFVFQTPRLRAPFSVNVSTRDGKKVYSLAMSLDGRSSNPAIQSFYNFGMQFDNWMIQQAIMNCASWLKISPKDVNETIIRSKYTPFLKFHKDEQTGENSNKYEPLCSAKLLAKDGKVLCEFLNTKNEIIPNVDNVEALLPGDCIVQCIIKASGCWFASGGFGNAFNITKCIIEQTMKLQGACFLPIGRPFDPVHKPAYLAFLQSQIYMPSALNNDQFTDNLFIDEPKQSQSSAAKSAKLTYNRKKLQMQFPIMNALFGVSINEREGKKSFEVALSFKGRKENPEMEALFQLGSRLDSWMVQQAMANSVQWLKVPKREANELNIKSKFYPFIKYSKTPEGEINTKYEPTLKIKLSTKDNALNCEIYTVDLETNSLVLFNNQNEEELIEMSKKADMIVQVEGSGVWMAAGDFGNSFRCSRLIILPNENATYAFVPDAMDNTSVVEEFEEEEEILVDSDVDM